MRTHTQPTNVSSTPLIEVIKSNWSNRLIIWAIWRFYVICAVHTCNEKKIWFGISLAVVFMTNHKYEEKKHSTLVWNCSRETNTHTSWNSSSVFCGVNTFNKPIICPTWKKKTKQQKNRSDSVAAAERKPSPEKSEDWQRPPCCATVAVRTAILSPERL